ncbi:MAG: hypothetical protein ACI9JN_000395 [Bacteroidia bacterium]|jgi:hypothetical protein
MIELEVKINKVNLECTINTEAIPNDVIRDLRIMLMNQWESIEFDPHSLKLHISQLKRSLPGILGWSRTRGYKIIFDEYLSTIVDRFARDRRGFKGEQLELADTFKEIQLTLNEVGFKRTLTERQNDDVMALLKLYHGANFSVPGAGKTTTLLALHSILKGLGHVNKMMVVCPINAFISWETEVFDIYAEKMTVVRLTKEMINGVGGGDIPMADVYISNYEKFRGPTDGLARLFTNNQVHMVLDESHRIKGGYSNQSFTQLIQLGDTSVRRDIMSGTPLPQSHKDLEAQFDFLWPLETIIPTTDEKNFEATTIHENIKTFYVRTTKKDLQLEPINYIETEVEMGTVQRELYKLIRSESARILARLSREKLNDFRFLGRSVIRLMQASTNPMLLTTSEDIYDELEGIPENSQFWELLEEYGRYEKPAKFEKLQERIGSILSKNQEAKVLIWSVFVKNILILQEMFKHLNPAVIYGAISSSGDDSIEESREGQIRKFHNDPSCRIMIANPQACGEGISLHRACHHAIYIERNYNAAHYLQSMDRIHRFGLTKGTETNIELITCKDSLDQRIDARLKDKIALMGDVLDDEFLRTMAYDPYDILEDEAMNTEDVKDIRSYLTEGHEET